MKKSILLFFITLIFGCENQVENNVVIDSQLIDKLNLIVSEYSSFYQKNQPLSDIDIYEVHFHKTGKDCFITINTNVHYNSNLDGFMLLKDNLIAFNFKNESCLKFIKLKSPIKQEYLSKFNVFDDENWENYNPAWWTFKIVGDSLVFDSQGRFKIDFEN